MVPDIRLLQVFLQHPAEAGDVDYKAAVQFDETSNFALKLVKHCLGFSNSGGGYVVVGFREGADGHPAPDPDLSDQILASYEVTRLAQHVNSFVMNRDSVDLVVHKIEFQNQRYPILSIRPFTKRPLFCGKTVRSRDNSEEILRAGVIYVRNKEAKTVGVAGPNEWDALINACVSARREEFLQAQKALFGQYLQPTLTTEQNPPGVSWIEQTRSAAWKYLHPKSKQEDERSTGV